MQYLNLDSQKDTQRRTKVGILAAGAALFALYGVATYNTSSTEPATHLAQVATNTMVFLEDDLHLASDGEGKLIIYNMDQYLAHLWTGKGNNHKWTMNFKDEREVDASLYNLGEKKYLCDNVGEALLCDDEVFFQTRRNLEQTEWSFQASDYSLLQNTTSGIAFVYEDDHRWTIRE